MKEFAMKHPIMTFLLIGSAIDGIVKVAAYISTLKFAANVVSEDENAEEVTEDESTGDIQ